MELRDYQRESVEAVWQHLRSRSDNPCVVLPTAAGKSVVLAELCRQAVSQWNGRVLVVTHVKELVEQNAAKLKAMLGAASVGIHSAGLNRRDLNHPVIAAGIQSVFRKACDLGTFHLVIVDECFPTGTLIDTPRGEIPIEDLYVGQPVRHALGVGNIEAISARPTSEMIMLELSDGRSIECTPNHRFFTDFGWREARALAVGTRLYSREDLSRLRQPVSAERMAGYERESNPVSGGNTVEGQNLLLSRMPANVPPSAKSESPVDEAADRGGHPADMAATGANNGQDLLLLRRGVPAPILRYEAGVGTHVDSATFLLAILREESSKPDVHPGIGGEGIRAAPGDRAPASDTRRERHGSDVVAREAGAEAQCGNGVYSDDDSPSTPGRGAKLLQTGCGDSAASSWNSTGRAQSCHEKSSGNGPVHPEMLGGIRVVGIVPVQCKSPRVVYNLQVEGHPSYYANGVLVHNCHLIPNDGEGMYRAFLADARIINPELRVIGLTATPYRMTSGDICSPGGILNHIAHEVGVKDLIDAGFLSPLISQAGREKADVTGLHLRGGEFIPGEIESLMDADALVRSAVAEIVEATRERRACIIFCAGVKHGEHVVRAFREDHGIECGFLDGNTPAGERARLIARFRGDFQPGHLFDEHEGPLRYLANVNVLTTGFDAPHIDCVAMLRPTNSPGLYYQQVGRGFRLAPGKTDCLVLDFANNITRHGPVDLLKAGDRPGPKGDGEAPAKECPDCHRVCHASIRLCPNCGYDFPKPDKPKHNARAATAPVISAPVEQEAPQDFEVEDVIYSEHHKRNAPPGHPPSMRVGYQLKGYTTHTSEWVCPQHSGYAREKFVDWWTKRSHVPPPRTVAEAIRLAQAGALAPTLGIRVKSDANGYERIIAWSLGEKPDFDSDAVFAAKDTEGDYDVGPATDDPFDNYDDIPF